MSFQDFDHVPGITACDDRGLARKGLDASVILECGIEVGVGLEINEPGEGSAHLLGELLDLSEHKC